MKIQLLGLLLLIIFVSIGCSGNPVLPDNQLTQNPGVQSIDTGRHLWGIFEISIDPQTLASEITPLRFGSFHANVRKFLEEGPCTNCLKVTPPIVPQPYGMDVNLAITHPFAGFTNFTGFDVRGIIMLEGAYHFPSYNYTSTRVAAGGWGLRNPDGYTSVFNASDYTMPGIFGYSKGKMVPVSWGNPGNDLNAFKAFYSNGQSEDAGGRRAFFAGGTVNRTYEIQTVDSQPFKFWYAVDASWEPPTGEEPYDLSDFPIEANCPEAYRFDFSVVSGELYPNGGSVKIGVDIYDHQGWSNPGYLHAEFPECSLSALIIMAPPMYVDGDRGHYEFNVTNMLGGLSTVTGTELLVKMENKNPDPFTGTIDGIGRFTIPVVDAPPPLDPVVISIDPDVGEQGGGIDNAGITGQNFQSGCTVRLEKTGEPNISGLDVVFIDSQHIAADFNLLGAAVGLWDVVVTNPDTKFGTLPEGFEVLEPSGCNKYLHNNYLGTGDFTGNHMMAYDACFVHDTGTESDGEFLGYVSGFGGTVVLCYIIDTLTPEPGHFLGTGWGNPHILSWPVPISIDIAEESGKFFIVWTDTFSIVEVWNATTGKYAGETDASHGGRVFCLDTDGSGGFWCGYFPEYGFAPGIMHFLPDGPQPGTLVEKTADAISLPEVWGTPTEIICIPDKILLVLTGSNNGKIRAYDISSSPPVLIGDLTDLFSGELDFGIYPDKPCDMVADWSNPTYADCRIIAFGNLKSGGVELVKIGADLTIWEGPIYLPTAHYESIDINPDTGDIALWPNRNNIPGEYALVERPAGW